MLLLPRQLVMLMLKVSLTVLVDRDQQVRDFVSNVLVLWQVRLGSLSSIARITTRIIVLNGHKHVVWEALALLVQCASHVDLIASSDDSTILVELL